MIAAGFDGDWHSLPAGKLWEKLLLPLWVWVSGKPPGILSSMSVFHLLFWLWKCTLVSIILYIVNCFPQSARTFSQEPGGLVKYRRQGKTWKLLVCKTIASEDYNLGPSLLGPKILLRFYICLVNTHFSYCCKMTETLCSPYCYHELFPISHDLGKKWCELA